MAWTLIAAIGLGIVLAPVLALWLAWRYSPLARSARRPAWKRSQRIVVAVMVVGAAVALIWPLWLAPPYFQYTPYVYLVLLVLWLPILFLSVLWRPSGSTFGAVLSVVFLGYLLGFLVLALAGPGFAVLAFEPQDCQQQPSGEGQVRYICKHNSSFGVASIYDLYTLEGPQGWPLVRATSIQHGDYP